MTDRKEHFAAMPMRAIGDSRLKASHLKLLMAIAAHDRMSKNGQGCWAGHKRLAELTGIALKSVSRTLNALAEWGYIEGSTHPLNKRTRVYKVIYLGADQDLFEGSRSRKTGNTQVTYSEQTGNTGVTLSAPIGNICEPYSHETKAFRPEEHIDKSQENHFADDQDTNPNIFCEAGIDSEEPEIDSVETGANQEIPKRDGSAKAPSGFGGGVRSIGQIAAKLTGMRSVTPLSDTENHRIEQAAETRLAGMLGHGTDGWSIWLALSEPTRFSLIEKHLTRTLTGNDLVSAKTEARLASNGSYLRLLPAGNSNPSFSTVGDNFRSLNN